MLAMPAGGGMDYQLSIVRQKARTLLRAFLRAFRKSRKRDSLIQQH
ncbi:MAG: hypothetical protein WB495_04670 [Xanthobacteraceae bacterium]